MLALAEGLAFAEGLGGEFRLVLLGGKLGLGSEPLDGALVLGDGSGFGPLGDESVPLGDGLVVLGDGLGLLGGELVVLGDGLVLLGDGLVVLGDGLGLGLVAGLGLGLAAGLGLVCVGPVVEVAHAVGLGVAVMVALAAGLIGAVHRAGCCDGQLTESGCW